MKKKKHDDSALSCSLIRRPIQRWGWLFLLPTFAAFCVGFLYPFAKGMFLSFCKFKTTSKWTWVGLKNYQTIFQDEGFLHAFWYTALFALVSLLVINVLAFAVAYVLTKGIKGSNIFRTVFFMPNLIGGIVLGYIWLMIFDGILSNFDTAVVLETKYGFWGLIILMCWQQIGYMMILYRRPAGHPRGYARGRKDRRCVQLENALEHHNPEHHAVYHHLHVPIPDQRLQALRPEPGPHGRLAL